MRGTLVACPPCDEKGSRQVWLKGMMMIFSFNICDFFLVFFLLFVFFFCSFNNAKTDVYCKPFLLSQSLHSWLLGEKWVFLAGSSISNPSNQKGAFLGWSTDPPNWHLFVLILQIRNEQYHIWGAHVDLVYFALIGTFDEVGVSLTWIHWTLKTVHMFIDELIFLERLLMINEWVLSLTYYQNLFYFYFMHARITDRYFKKKSNSGRSQSVINSIVAIGMQSGDMAGN